GPRRRGYTVGSSSGARRRLGRGGGRRRPPRTACFERPATCAGLPSSCPGGRIPAPILTPLARQKTCRAQWWGCIARDVLPQSEPEFAFAGVSGNTLAEEHP